MIKERGSGILLHITSLPSRYGIGDLGPDAYRFVDLLAEAGQKYWQVLPLNPTEGAFGHSPYSSYSAFAGNILLISPQLLVEEGFLTPDELRDAPHFPEGRCDYDAVVPYKIGLLDRAYQRFRAAGVGREDFEGFCSINSYWLEDFSAFIVLKIKRFNWAVWSEWEPAIRDRDPNRLRAVKQEQAQDIEREKFFQFLFYRQWHRLRRYCNGKGVRLIGDIPIYVCYDSADVWEHSGIFKLDNHKKPAQVAGVPPDYFSKTGQLWGNPVYNWEVLKDLDYYWWMQRMGHNFSLFDMVRVDHFRGFVGFWEVPAGEKTAINGKWVKAPADEFFAALTKKFPELAIIAEDLGIITDDVREIMKKFGFPGMKILLFAFGEDLKKHPYLPHNYSENCVVYTGTHDNNTVRGWFENEAPEKEKKQLAEYLKEKVTLESVNWQLIELAMRSRARISVFPLQDIFGLGEEARMNLPSRGKGNWEWRMTPEQFDASVRDRLLELARGCAR